jgi:hypothetical protein
MASTQNELSALISKTVEEQTFSLDAVKAIGAIRDRAIALEGSLAATTRLADDRAEQLAKQAEVVRGWEAKSAAMDARASTLVAREAKITELEKTTAVAQAQFTTLDNVFSRIFANRQIRESTLTSAPIAQQASGGSYVSNYDTRNTIDRTEA